MNSATISFAILAAVLLGQEPPEPSPPAPEAVRDEPLRRELEEMMKEDQEARQAFVRRLAEAGVPMGSGAKPGPEAAKVLEEEAKKLKAVDDRNRARLGDVVGKHGWPGASRVGSSASHAAWLLVQHADDDRPFQKKCLALMEAAPKGEAAPADVAYLTDRVLVGDKKPQRYGTQLDNDFKPLPIDDEPRVDERRAAVGLPPLAQYLREAREFYESFAKPKK